LSRPSSIRRGELVEETDSVPDELAAEIRAKSQALGLYAVNMPAELGSSGLGTFDTTLMERELGRASYGLQMMIARPSNILRGARQPDRGLPPPADPGASGMTASP